MGCIISGLACCFCGAAANLCCACCPSCKSSTSARIMYGIMLILGTITSCILLIPDVQEAFQKIPALCAPIQISGQTIISGNDCSFVVGFSSVYRISFGLSCFFFLFMLIMLGVSSSKDPRSKIQNGFWAFKFLILIGLIVAAFFIPSGSFSYVWMIFGFIGSFVFIVIQMVMIIDFAHRWNELWVDNADQNDSKMYYCGLSFFTILFYAASITGITLLFVYYTNDSGCTLNKFLISLNLILCVIISVVSILPKVQEVQPHSGLLQASLLSAYIIYLTWSSLTNGEDKACNPSLNIWDNTTETKSGKVYHDQSVLLYFNAESIVGLVIFFIFLIYACFRTNVTDVGRATVAGNTETTVLADEGIQAADAGERSGQHVWDDEEGTVTYSYTLFHLMLLLGSLYMMMMLTNWYEPNSTMTRLEANKASLWLKMSASWLCVGLYAWTLVAPIVLPDRDFS